MWSSREASEEKSPPAEAPAPGPAERKSTTNGDDARPAGLLHEPHELSTSTLTKLEAASDAGEFQQSIWDASLFLFNPVVGRSASLFAFVLLAVNVFLQGSFAFYLIESNNSTVITPYWLGRNLCVRGRGHKPLSFFCPEACGCHRGDEDCPLTCPEREATTPICLAHQQKTFLLECLDPLSSELCCPRHPRAYGFDVGFSSVGTSGTARAAAAGDE